MQALIVQGRYKTTQPFGANRHATTHTLGPRYIDFINIDDQFFTRPFQTAGSNFELVCAALNMRATALGHRPTLPSPAIQGHIQGAEIFRICNATLKASRQSVIRRKNAPNKSDDGQTIFAIVTQRIDIPPEITTRLDLLIKPRSSISVAAAKRPDMAAIGRPGPGCTLPPAV